MRRTTLPVAVLAALVLAAGASATPVFVLSGHGWGHGVGMSQYGALGRAQAGQGYRDILGFYYDGTTVGKTTRTKMKVLLMEGQSSVTLRSSRTFKVGDKKLAPFTDYTVVPAGGGKVRVVGKGTFTSPATATPGDGFLRVDGMRYRGDLKLYNNGGTLQVVNVVGLQGYLFSVVPREMPASWPAEALKAQAVAARSYAVRASRGGSRYDIYDDTRDQVYGGLDYGSGEEASSTDAVKATDGEVVKYGGGVASTYFSSSNGGRTAASADTWGGSVPYLVSKADVFDLNASNPNRSWTVVLSPRALQNRLGAGQAPTDALVTSRVSGRVNRIRLDRGSWARTVPSTGLGPEWFRGALGLRSSRFDLGVLNVTPSKARSVCRSQVRLDVLARDVQSVTLQRKRTAGSWTAMSVEKVDSAHYDGTDRPCRETAYRLHSPAAKTAPVTVEVAPRIVFDSTQPAGGVALRGVVKPASLAGQTVVVSRKRKDGTWKRTATATVSSNGTWRAEFHVTESVYRARISPPASSGLVTGYSPPLSITFS